MSYAIERYLDAVRASGNRANFNDHFIGTLSAKFDYNLTEASWDDALTKATNAMKDTL